jgi:hypothetical protein
MVLPTSHRFDYKYISDGRDNTPPLLSDNQEVATLAYQ